MLKRKLSQRCEKLSSRNLRKLHFTERKSEKKQNNNKKAILYCSRIAHIKRTILYCTRMAPTKKCIVLYRMVRRRLKYVDEELTLSWFLSVVGSCSMPVRFFWLSSAPHSYTTEISG
jgi:hypothetical protein